MGKIISSVVILALIAGLGVLGFKYLHQGDMQRELVAKLGTVQEELTVTRNTLLGFTKFTDYVIAGKKAIEGQSKFLAAKVTRDFINVEHVQKSFFGLKSDAHVTVTYAVEYSVGFDLQPGKFTIANDGNGITVTLGRPELVSAPSVSIKSHEILGKGILTDEKGAIIALQQRLLPVAQQQAAHVVRDLAIIALCEKKFGDFLTDFMSRQPGVKFVPAVRFTYK